MKIQSYTRPLETKIHARLPRVEQAKEVSNSFGINRQNIIEAAKMGSIAGLVLYAMNGFLDILKFLFQPRRFLVARQPEFNDVHLDSPKQLRSDHKKRRVKHHD